MAITDSQVAALRAQLAGQPEEHRRLLDELDPVADDRGYAILLTAAFFEAVGRCFGEQPPNQAEVVEFVGRVRARSENVRQKLPADAAERAITGVYGDAELGDIDAHTMRYAQVVLTVALISEEHLEDAGLDAFMADARSLAEQLRA